MSRAACLLSLLCKVALSILLEAYGLCGGSWLLLLCYAVLCCWLGLASCAHNELLWCLHRNPEEFSKCLHHAMTHEPRPLTDEHLRKLTWEDATERFLQVAELQQMPPLHEQLLDGFLAAAHHALTNVEGLRRLAGML